MDTLRHLEVGQLFEPGRTRYQETVKFEFTPGGPVLLIYFERPNQKEIAAIRSGKFKFGFYEHDIGSVIFTLSKFEGLKWMDAPYSIHLSPPFEFAPELDTDQNLGFALQIFLIDAATGILHVIRYVGLGHDFSVKFKEALQRQKAVNFNQAAYNLKIDDAYKRYSTDDLVSYAKWFYTVK
jgi:hypothetical protein